MVSCKNIYKQRKEYIFVIINKIKNIMNKARCAERNFRNLYIIIAEEEI